MLYIIINLVLENITLHHIALVDAIDNCYSNLAQGNKVIEIFFDLQKAFDSVNYKILLDYITTEYVE